MFDEDDLVRLGCHREVGLCFRCARWVQRRAAEQAAADRGGLDAQYRGIFGTARGWVLRHDLQDKPVIGRQFERRTDACPDRIREPSPTRPARNEPPPRGNRGRVKKILELLVCFLHPIAVVLGWANLLGRGDLSGGVKLVWAIALIIPIVPFLYVLTGGDLW